MAGPAVRGRPMATRPACGVIPKQVWRRPEPKPMDWNWPRGTRRPGAPVSPGRLITGKRYGNSMNMKRMRGRNHRGGGSGGGGGGGGGGMRHQGGGGSGGNVPLNRNHVFDSNGPDIRVRGTAQQLFEKYLQLGRDATSGGDRVMAEGYFQHAEHYFRILNAMNQAAQQNQPQQGGGQRRPPLSNDDGQGQMSDQPSDEAEVRSAPGIGDQPESRDIPIAAAPPEG